MEDEGLYIWCTTTLYLLESLRACTTTSTAFLGQYWLMAFDNFTIKLYHKLLSWTLDRMNPPRTRLSNGYQPAGRSLVRPTP